jgi:thioredoxin 1
METKPTNGLYRARISYAIKFALLVLVVFMAAGVLTISAIRPGVIGNTAVAGNSLPVLVDLGADRCVPCRMMAPILEELKKEYKGKLDVVFYDVWKDSAPAQKYKINYIPTQIFLDENGKELYRHVGFYSKEAILDKWKELGYDLQ